MPADRVLLAAPRGFCAGVEMAIKALAWMVRAFEPPVYCYHEIVHNRLVVERFREQGVIFVDDPSEVPAGAPLMLSAHGSAPEVVSSARAEGRYVVNAVCPLVTKVHHEARVRARKGFTILYVGHAGHDEAVGTLAVAPEAIRLVEHADDLERVIGDVDDPTKLAIVQVARDAGCRVVVRVDGPEELDLAQLGGAQVVGVTAGASAPEELVNAVIAVLAPADGVEGVRVTDEDEYFPPPPELREL